MKRIVVTVAIVVLSIPTMLAATGALKASEPRGSIVMPTADDLATRQDAIDGWPAPSPPFDETPITPVESAGAPMFP